MAEGTRPTAKPASSSVAPRPAGRSNATGFPIVAIGASAGGLEACAKFLDALPKETGTSFILVQHLGPRHDSLMVDLLATHTSMAVRQASEGMLLEREQLVVIPPGRFLSVRGGAIHLTSPPNGSGASRGARMPFDVLLHSLADDCGARTVCVVLSGTGTDGSMGLRSVNRQSGMVIAQDPEEAAYDGMPKSAIATGLVDHVLPVAKMADVILRQARREDAPASSDGSTEDDVGTRLGEIVALLASRTSYDFRPYKPGTLQRRIERRMTMADVGHGDAGRYLSVLRRDPSELELLAKDLLINVTRFFRDPKVFDVLVQTILPDLVRNHPSERPIRLWVPACSSGEEAYSLAMVVEEAIDAANSDVKLQVFASDLDPDAVATARDALYPDSIRTDVSRERLARFFAREDHGYRVLPLLRSCVIVTVQDVLCDPPFSRIDLISCRNLMIYLGAEAQRKVVSLFHFALNAGGMLLLGSSETAGDLKGRFEVISKPERMYRRVGPQRFSDVRLSMRHDEAMPVLPAAKATTVPRETMLADLCRQLLADAYAPAAVLIDRSRQVLYAVGPTDRYLRMAKGVPSRDLMAMTAPELRAGLKSALRKATVANPRVVSQGIKMTIAEHIAVIVIDVRSVTIDGDDLFLVCFVEEPFRGRQADGKSAQAKDGRCLADLERELEAARSELTEMSRDLEVSNEAQRTINEEALYAKEEYQSTNEELLTSKEELQSLNEELTALNGQLQEALERQRTTSDDLQNVLYSTDVATLFLDTDLNIRFFTPATKSLFRVIPGDVGRPLADLNSLASDTNLPGDARAVLRTLIPIDREVEVPGASWFNRRILPYRAHDGGVEGVVITFTDITDRKLAATALEAARREADRANLAKSRFLAAASHDLRQPLQSLVLLQGLLAKTVDADAARQLVTRMDHTLGAMSGMLNTLLDIKQIEAGVVRPNVSEFAIDAILERLHEEFAYQAGSQGLDLRRVPCSAHVRSDPALLEQMMRNLVSNALKYTKHGKALIGCRRRSGMLHIEVWDTGLGIPEHELQAIFEEYHQVANAARERSRGLGLGLPIVQRLGQLLGHKIRVRSTHGRGSVFFVEVPLAHHHASSPSIERSGSPKTFDGGVAAGGTILVVDDDPDIRDLLQMLLSAEGYVVTVAAGAEEAVEAVDAGEDIPRLLLADYNLPGGMDGLAIATRLRTMAGGRLPAIILTGDISTRSLQQIAHDGCAQLNKPVKPEDLFRLIRKLLVPGASPPASPADGPLARDDEPIRPVVFVVDDDEDVRESIRCVLEADGRVAELFATSEAFLDAYRDIPGSCLLVDAYLPGMSGLDLLRKLRDEHPHLPAIMITGSSDVATAVTAMKAGASDFIEKPITGAGLLASLDLALEQSRDGSKAMARKEAATAQLVGLTARQRQIMGLVLSGHPSKNIAADLGISRRTVENHRAAIMTKTGSRSLPELVRLALFADVIPTALTRAVGLIRT